MESNIEMFTQGEIMFCKALVLLDRNIMMIYTHSSTSVQFLTKKYEPDGTGTNISCKPG